jgi:uncharacterized phage-associated protein
MKEETITDRQPTALDTAKFFLSRDDGAGDLISNLQMQKLVYYAQGIHLAVTGRRLFDESLEAWIHGPVSPGLCRELKRFGEREVTLDFRGSDSAFTNEQLDILKDVWIVYGQFSAWALRDKTHSEPPWLITTHNGEVFGKVIGDSLMTDYFRTRLVEEKT